VSTEIQIQDQGGVLQAATALILKYKSALVFEMNFDWGSGSWGMAPKYPVNSSSRLIPRSDLRGLIAAMESTLKPASPKEVAGAASLIATAWPFAWQRLDDQTAAAFAAQLNEEMSKYPAPVLRDAVVSLRRSQKFPPAIAEFVEAAEAEMEKIRGRLRLARQHEQEHARRARIVLQEEERHAERRRQMQDRLDKLIRTYGPACMRWIADDVADAGDGFLMASVSTLCAWMEAMEAGGRWVPAVMPLAVVAGRARKLHQSGHLPADAFCRLLQIARTDPENALAMVSGLTATADPKDRANLPAALTAAAADQATDWRDPCRFLSSLFAEIRDEIQNIERTTDAR
jgi:hypothetical protein